MRPAALLGGLLALAFVGCDLGDGPALGRLPAQIDDGIHVRPLPMGAPPAAVSLADAIRASRGESEEEAASAARRVVARPAPTTVWVIAYAIEEVQRPCGGSPDGSLGPGQPRRMCWMTHHGSFVDDQSGSILYSFYIGRFIGSPAGGVIWFTDADGRLAWFRILPPQ